MELLSPAGNRDALIAAISCGADAVYLGYTAFGARSYAGNFDDQQLKEAVDYAHERGKKIYVTVNTLVKQCEVDDLCDVLELLVQNGVDAAIVQDLGVVRIARERFPELAIHASTQMTVNNAQGARLLKDLGLTRVVPARECALDELRKMADTGIEIEAFAHGALCVAVSGQCLFSSLIGGRSGNRGRCAQPCRLPYQLNDGTKGYLLSTRDLMLVEHIPQMRDAGVYSFKLEGRMKRPEYVGVITRAYREALDAAEAHVPYTVKKETIESLKQVFNRGGFTKGYAMEQSNASLMSWERPNHWGIRVGQIVSSRNSLARVLLEKPLHDGDGLQVRGKKELDFTYSGNEMESGSEAIVRVSSSECRSGDVVYRLTDATQMKAIRDIMSKEQVHIPLTAKLYAVPGELPELSLLDSDGNQVHVTGTQPVLLAQQRALDIDSATKQLSKMGGTPYVLEKLELDSAQAFMTTGMLNDLRRQALQAMAEARRSIIRMNIPELKMPVTMPKQQRLLIAQSENLSDAQELLNAGANMIYWNPQVYIPTALEQELKNNANIHPVLVLPFVTSSLELLHIHEFVCLHSEQLSGVLANNIGQLALDWPVEVFGGQGLNVFNHESAQFYTSLGTSQLTASCELNEKELRELQARDGNFEIEVYGGTQLMLLNHCPRRTARGDCKQDTACQDCAKDGGTPAIYTDRKGYQFPTRRQRMEHGCVIRVFNSVTTDMARYASKLFDLGMSLRVSFTDESLSRRKEIVSSYRNILDGGIQTHSISDMTTSGHFVRGVE